METENKIYKKAKTWQIYLAPLSNGVNNLFIVLMMFASYVAAGGYGIAVAVAGTVIMGTRIFDGITDPIIALICDRINTRFGRIRIIMGLGYLIMCASVYALFFIGIGHGIVFFTITYLFYIIGYTMYGVGYQAMNPVLTNDPGQRPKLARMAMIYTQVLSTLFAGVYLSIILVPKYGGLTIPAFQELALTSIGFGAVLLILSLIAVSPVDKPENFISTGSKNTIGIKDMWNLIKSNRALQMYIFAASSDKLALQSASQQAINTMVLGIIINNYSFGGWMSFVTLPIVILLLYWVASQSGKNGSKTALVRWTWISIIVSAAYVAFMAIGNPVKISRSIIPTVLFVGFTIARSACTAATSAATGAMLPDIIDYEFNRTGNFMPSSVAACYSFVDKLISSLATTIVGFCLAAIGYVNTMPQPGDPSTPAIFWMAMFLQIGLPVIGWLCTIIAMKFYPLDKEKMAQIAQENYERRQNAKPETLS